MNNLSEKQCSKCKEIKPIESFCKKKDGKGGINSICKKCISRYCKLYLKNNSEKVSEYQKRYYKNNKEKVLERERERRDDNPEYLKEYYKKNISNFQRYREINADIIKEKHKRYRQNNQQQMKTNNHNRRAMEQNAIREKFDFAKIYEDHNWICGICGKNINKNLKYPHLKSVSLDHIVPLSSGGNHIESNIQPAHFICNSKKGNRTMNMQLIFQKSIDLQIEEVK